MQITSIKVSLSEQGSSANKATVSVTLNNSLILRGISVVQKKDSDELIVRMPIRKTSNGSIHEYFHPITKEARAHLTKVVLDAYHTVCKNPENPILWFDCVSQLPKLSSVQICPIENDRLVKALVTILFDDAIALNQIRVICDEEKGKTWIAMPAKKVDAKDKDGNPDPVYLEYFNPVTKEFREILTDQIFFEYAKQKRATA